MTRFLSTSLQATEPYFRHGLQRLEVAHGHPNTDIHLTAAVAHTSRQKMLQLGLDPKDTTPQELYKALEARVAADDKRLTRTLQTRAATYVSAEADVIAGIVHALHDLPETKRCYAIKPSVMKSLLKKNMPKKAMKKLGYRSVDSFLKHESVVTIIAAAWLTEGVTWRGKLFDQYKKLTPADFETRNMVIQQLKAKRWTTLADDVVGRTKHTVLPFKELGAIVLLPLPQDAPAGAATVSLSLALHQMNEIRASSTFLKLSQVRANFGALVRTVAVGEPELSSSVLDKPVPWHLVQRYYARNQHQFDERVFEPHVQLEDMIWHPIEQTLKHIEPSLGFWSDGAHVGTLHGSKPVSFNIIDVAINYCNKLPFEQRATHYFQASLWHELLLGYLRPDSVEHSVLHELQPQYAQQLAIA